MVLRRTALDGRGGGLALPPYLQGRAPTPGGKFNTKPMITPRLTGAPGDVAPPKGLLGGYAGKQLEKKSPITPAGAQPAITPYEFGKGELERERDKALSGAIADASARGVYYGTPLTTSQGDINAEFQRGLGQFTSNLMQDEQQNELHRMNLAMQLLGAPMSQAQLAQMGQSNPELFQLIGSLFAPRTGPANKPAITPNKATGLSTQPGPGFLRR